MYRGWRPLDVACFIQPLHLSLPFWVSVSEVGFVLCLFYAGSHQVSYLACIADRFLHMIPNADHMDVNNTSTSSTNTDGGAQSSTSPKQSSG